MFSRFIFNSCKIHIKFVNFFQQIVLTLQEKSDFKIARVSFAGSFGKKTNIRTSDVDLVLFINDQNPPFDHQLKSLYDTCVQSALKSAFNIKLNKNSLKMTNQKYEIDVVLATNFVKEVKKHKSLPHLQQYYALQRISQNYSENNYIFSSALAEASVYFMKTRVGFANEMARLAKYWFKQFQTNYFSHISGASTFIELVAVYAARKGQLGNRKFNSHLKSFIKFLQLLMNFEKLDVSFNRCNPMFKEHAPADTTTPRVIDPVNPYNNFVSYWCKDNGAIEKLKEVAAKTYERLQDFILNPNDTFTEDHLIGKIFQI